MMTAIQRNPAAAILALGLIWQSGGIAQEHHQHHHIETVQPSFPRLGKGQEQITGSKYTLGQLEHMALAANPTLAEAEAEVRGAQGKRLQAGLYPNPRAGFEGEELRGGSYGGGEKGFFVAQPLITAGKLGLNRKIVDQEAQISRQRMEAQRYRILNAVRIAYVRLLAAQEMVETRKDLARIAKDVLKVAQQLQNIGQADDTEVLQAEIEDLQAEIAVVTEENTLHGLWTALLAVVGNPGVPAGGVTGGLDAGPLPLSEERALDSILKDSPAIRIAQAGLARAEAAVKRARVETIPNLELKGGLQQNSGQCPSGARRGGPCAPRIAAREPVSPRPNVGHVPRVPERKSHLGPLRRGNPATRAEGLRAYAAALWTDVGVVHIRSESSATAVPPGG
jgi:outer membrane protein TolC